MSVHATMEWIFTLSLGTLAYTFMGYPLLLLVLSRLVARPVRRGAAEPRVAIIIPVHNAERVIGAKLENCLGFTYPNGKLSIVVVSDGCTDGTAEIVRRYAGDRVMFLDPGFRGGKVAAQNFAVRFSEAQICVFTDVAITTEPDCIRRIVENFADETVGAVSCRDAVLVEEGKTEGEGEYIRYDMMVRQFASAVGSLIGVTGGFYAVRRSIARGGWNPAFPPDFYVALRTIKQGLRVIEDPRVTAYYRTAAKEWDELPRKVRTINRGITALFCRSNRSLLNPLRYGYISLELFSHKLLRWLAPFFFALLFTTSLALSGRSRLMLLFFLFQAAVYLSGVASILIRGDHAGGRLFKLPGYFVMANLALLKAWWEVATGRRYVMWEPTKR